MDSQPREIIKHILGFIPGNILIHLTRVSKEWLDLIENHILRLDVIPSFEECVMTQNYFYGRCYLNHPIDRYQKKLIKIVNDKIFIRRFKITRLRVTINDTLIEYSKRGDINVVKLLLERGADLHANNNCALRWSAEHGHIEVVKLLLEKGADLHADNEYLFCYIAEIGQIDMVKLFLEEGADIHANNDYALCWSALNGHIEVVKLLLDKGANPHADNDHALCSSARNGHFEVVKLLLDNGANPHAENDYALRLSAENGHHDVVKLLLEKGADISVLSEELQIRYKKLII